MHRTIAATPDDVVSMTVFARVVESKSFTAAAQKLGLSKSVVSWRMSKLEEKLGARLLERTTRKLSLTPAGLRFYERCARVVAEADEAAEMVAGGTSVASGPLRVNAPVALGQLWMAEPIAAFLRAHPETRIDLQLSDRVVDLVEQGFDLAVRVTSRLADPTLVVRKLGTDRRVICGAPEYLAAAGAPERPEDLLHHNCLGFSLLRRGDEWRFRDAGGAVSLPAGGNFRADNTMMLQSAARAGVGLAVLPRYVAARDLAEGRLRAVLEPYVDVELGIYAIGADARAFPPRVRAFVDQLARYFRRAPWHHVARDGARPPPRARRS